MKTSLRRILKSTTAATMAAGFLAASAAAASAHVSVDPSATSAGGFTKLTFSVPNESETAKTNRIEVKLPTDTPLTSVSVKPMDGWKATVVTTKLPKPVEVDGATVTMAPTSVIWTADATHQIGQNEFQTFTLSVGRLPAADTKVTVPVLQGYTDGTAVNWADAAADHDHPAGTPSAAASEAEEPHPAPSFITTAADGENVHGGAMSTAMQAPAAQAASPSSTGTAGWVGIAAGLIGLAAGVTALTRNRSSRGN